MIKMWEWIAAATYARRRCVTEKNYKEEHPETKIVSADVPQELYAQWQQARRNQNYRHAAEIAQHIAMEMEEI